MIKTEDLLKDFLREFKNWLLTGDKEPTTELINKRQELMRRLRKLERDSKAMDRLRDRNKNVLWVYRDDIGFLARSVGDVVDPHAQKDKDPTAAILGKD